MKKSIFFPFFLVLLLNPGTLFRTMGQQQTIADKGRQLNLPPSDEVRNLVKRAVDLTEDDRLDEALNSIKRALALSPNYLRVHIEYINIKGNFLGEFDQLEAEYGSLVKKEPENPVYLMAAFFSTYGMDKKDALRKVFETAPEWAWGHYAKALLVAETEPQQAVDELVKSIGKDPYITEAYYMLIRLQETRLNRVDDAIATAEIFASRPELRAKALPLLWRLRLKKANETEDAKAELRKELHQLTETSADLSLLTSIRTAYSDLLKDRESSRLVEEKIREVEPGWYSMRGWRFNRMAVNESGVPRYLVLANRQLVIYNKTREAAESPDPQDKISRLEVLLIPNLHPTLRRIIYEDIFRIAVKANIVAATVKYGQALLKIDPSDRMVFAKMALVLAKGKTDLKKALEYARIADAATAEFRPAKRTANTPQDVFDNYFSEKKQREVHRENRATALDAFGWTQLQLGNVRDAEASLRSSVTLKSSVSRLTRLAAALRKLGRDDEADGLLREADIELAQTVRRNLVSEPIEDLKMQSIDNIPFKLSDLKGQVVVINLWATWCGPCREELPLLNRLYEKYKVKGVSILAVSTDEERRKVPRFVSEYKLTLPVLYDMGMQAYFKAETIPTTVFIGRDGKVRYRKIGFDEMSDRELEAVIVELTR